MDLYEEDLNAENMERFRTKIYSIGPDKELHGPILPKNVDGLYSRHVAQRAAEKTGTDYVGHLPYSGDKNPLMRKLNNYLENDQLTDMIIEHLTSDIEKRRTLPNNIECSNIILVCGHGGNSFIQDNIKAISQEVKFPVTYIHPLVGLKVNHPIRGEISPGHANDCEHSIGIYLKCFNNEAYKKLNEEAAKNPEETLAQFPVLNCLSGFMMEKYFPGEEYQKFREQSKGREKKTLEFIENAKKGQAIFASREVGRYFTEGNIETVIREILK